MASPSPGTHFSLSNTSTNNKFSPRLGTLLLHRSTTPKTSISIPTPGILTTTSRGVIPHLSRDHQNLTGAVKWVHIPFETFLEHNPPVPTMQKGTERHPLHRFLGYLPGKHILSLSIRDPDDGKEMPTNGNEHLSAYCLRGVRKVSPADWRSYTLSCKPDLVVALSDTPYTNPPYSQKRLTKSIERSAAWLATLLRPYPPQSDPPPSILVHMAGLTSIPARRAFAESLLEQLHGTEAEAVKPHQCLDEGVSGYTFDLVPIRLALGPSSTSKQAHQPSISTLLQASLQPLPQHKLRLVNSTRSPHEVLDLISTVGVDVFDAGWAQRAAGVGVALDFRFPVRRDSRGVPRNPRIDKDSTVAEDGEVKLDIGHNLYLSRYAHDFSALGDTFCGAAQAREGDGRDACPCGACSPVRPSEDQCIVHDTIDLGSFGVSTSFASTSPSVTPGSTSAISDLTSATSDPTSAASSSTSEASSSPSPASSATPTTSGSISITSGSISTSATSISNSNALASPDVRYQDPFTRAYIHHLLHTHEMSAHALLVMHNLAVLEAFFAGIREVLGGSDLGGVDGPLVGVNGTGKTYDWAHEVELFNAAYDGTLKIVDDAKEMWRDVDLARGKGRLGREKEREQQDEA